MSAPVKLALVRAARTFAQAFVGFVVTSGLLSGAATSGLVDWSDVKKVLISAAAAGVSAVVAFAHNLLQPVAPPAAPVAALEAPSAVPLAHPGPAPAAP